MIRFLLIFANTLGIVLVFDVASAQKLSPGEQQGFDFVRANCSRCHAIDHKSASPLEAAPPFRTLHLRYPVEDLQESLVEGISTGHPNMPEFQLDPEIASHVIAYLKRLER